MESKDFEIHINKIEEAGYKSAMLGLSFNKKQKPEGMKSVAENLSNKDYGHNKFMEHIETWWDIRAPRYWWQEADTYRLSSKQSESTIHTVLKRPLQKDDFECGNLGVSVLNLNVLNILIRRKEFLSLKRHLPESFMQRREWKLSYKTLRNIIIQRRNHKLPHWKKFCDDVINQVEHPELLNI